MAFQLVRNFFGQSSPSRSGAYEPVVESESFGNQGGRAHYDTRDAVKTAKDSNWFELARQDKETNGQKGRKPYRLQRRFTIYDIILLQFEDILFSAGRGLVE